jgi:hypothetical protein
MIAGGGLGEEKGAQKQAQNGGFRPPFSYIST